jgi:hypothetical protein
MRLGVGVRKNKTSPRVTALAVAARTALRFCTQTIDQRLERFQISPTPLRECQHFINPIGGDWNKRFVSCGC